MDDLTAVVEGARARSEAGAYAEALALLDQAPDRGAASPEFHTARGWALENLGADRLADARLAYEAAVALDPDQPWALAGLANVLGRLGEREASARTYRDLIARATPRAPADPSLLELVGWSQYSLGRYDDAVGTFRRALAVDPAWGSVWFDLGLALLARGESREADAAYDQGLKHRTGPGSLAVALDDLDQALERSPSLRTPEARAIRARLAESRDG